MSKVLIIESYLNKDFSLTEYALNKFIDEYKKINPNDEFLYLDLNKEKKLKTILNAENFNDFWNDDSQKYIDLLFAADKIIITSGMVNFSISPTLKNFLDNILVANKTFKYKYDGSGTSVGLLKPETKVQLIMSQGAYEKWYPFAAFDDYLEKVLNFAGLKNVQKIVFHGSKTHEQEKLTLEEKFNLKKDEFYECLKNF